MRIESECFKKEGAFCPTDCPLYKLSERMAIGALNNFPEIYGMETSGTIETLAMQLGITEDEIEEAKANCSIEVETRKKHPEILN